MQPILKGQRQTSLHKKAGELLYEGMTKEQICKVLDVINHERCTPPLSPGKLKHVKDFVMKWTKVISPDGEVTDVMG